MARAKSGKKGDRNYALYRPRIAYQQAQRSYFLHSGMAYSVASAPEAIFRAALLVVCPTWKQVDPTSEVGRALTGPLDIFARWFLLCALAEARHPMKLFDSREEATQSIENPCVTSCATL